MKLSELKIGQTAIILDLNLDAKALKRFNDLGLAKGERITVIRFAPLNCPIQVKINGFYLALRKKDARFITVKLL